MRLADFKDGIVVGVQFPKLRKDRETIDQVRAWIASGKLRSPVANPDPMLDVLYLSEQSATGKKPPPTTLTGSTQRAKPPENVPKSWPYQCGEFRRAADGRDGVKTKNPLVGFVGEQWQAGYDGRPEPVKE
jgi:hypothetical protein